jgi:S1-C subfamily serine protease/tetratricopeptide (TPR) repeat protein
MRPAGGLLLFVVLLGGILSAVEDRPLPEPPRSAPEVYRRTVRGVGWVHSAGSGKGTGWIADRERRWLVTCVHVVGDNDSIDVVFPVSEKGQIVAARAWYLEHFARLQKDGYVVRGQVIRREPASDLALVELASLPPEVIGLAVAAEGVSPGDRVFAVGVRYDSDALWGFTGGSVRGPRVMREGYFSGGKELGKGARVIEATAPINEGDSGGPLVNTRGEVVGVCAAVEWKAHGAGLFVDRTAVLALLERAGRKPGPAPDPGPAPTTVATPGREVYRRALAAVALVQGPDPKLRATAWVVDRRRRLLLTTAEFVGRQEKVALTFPVNEGGRLVSDWSFYRDNDRRLRDQGRHVVGCVLATDARRNLVLVEAATVPDDVTELRRSSEVPAPGESVHAVGNPMGTETLWLYNGGWVRQTGHVNLGQTMDGPDPAVVLVQAPVTEGEAGSPLLNDRAEVVGVVTGRLAAQQQISYALTSGEVNGFLEDTRAKWQPRTAGDWCARAAVFVKARLYDRAILDFDQALEAEPSCAVACSERSRVNHLRGRDDLALADAERALKLDARLVSAFVHRAAVRNARGEPRRAVDDCDTALRLDPDNALAHAVRAEARRQLGELGSALADADEAVRADGQLALAYLTRGLIHAQGGNHTRAIDDFGRALVHDPECGPAFRARGDAFWARSDVTAALDDYDRALALNCKDAAALHGRGRARAARKEFDAALADLDAAIGLDPRLATARVDRGAELLRRGDLDRGFADFDEAVRVQPRLAGDVLFQAERRVSVLVREQHNDAAAAYTVCRRTLLLVQPLVHDRPDIRRIVEAALALTPKPSQLAPAVARLREVLAAVRAAVSAE